MPDTPDPPGFSSEIKFLVDPAVAQRVREWARQHLTADPHGGRPHGDEYRTTSLYFDTRGFDVFHRRGSFGRAKFRVRRYGDLPILFLERKLKREAFLHKRRTTIPIERLPLLDPAAAPPPEWDGTWFRRRLLVRALGPVCEIAYLRTARTGVAEGRPIRVTIDADVVARPADDLRLSMDAGVPVLPSQCVIEMKFQREPPALLRRAIEDFRLSAAAVSKYRASAEALGLATATSAARSIHA